MSTRAELLTGLRVRLGDLTGTRWADDELTSYLLDGARDYSKYFPRKREQEFTADGASQRYDVPADLIDDQVMIVRLTNPLTLAFEEIPHKQVRRRGSNRYYEVVGEQLVFGFVPETARTVLVRYNATHDIPANGESTVPFEDEDLIYAYGMAVAWQRVGGNDAGLSRWKEEGKRDDSPLIPHYVRLWARYDRLVEQKQSVPRFYQRVRAKGRWRSYADDRNR